MPSRSCQPSYFRLPLKSDTVETESALAVYLARHVNAGAGDSPAAQWFERRPDGAGIGMAGINLDHVLVERNLDAGEFPPLLLAPRPGDAAHQQLYDDFQCWQAPWLLALSNLDRKTRAQLENQAGARPLLVAQQYRLYPEIIDALAIRAARVEARLRQSAPEERESDSVLPPEYIELHPSPTE